MTVFEEHALEMYSEYGVAEEGFLGKLVAAPLLAIGEKIKRLLEKIFIGNAYFNISDPIVIKDYMMYTNAKNDGVNIFNEFFNNSEGIRELTIKFNDATSEKDISKILDQFNTFEKKLDTSWRKYIPNQKDIYEIIQIKYIEYMQIVKDINFNFIPNIEDLLPFIQTVINNTKNKFPTKSKELQKIFDNLFLPYIDMMINMMYHLYTVPAPDLSLKEVVEVFPSDRKPWFFLYDMPVFKSNINGSAFMYRALPTYQGKVKYPKGAIFVDNKTFHLMPDYYQMFVLYHEYGHSMAYRHEKHLAMSNNEYYEGECLADLFGYAIMDKNLEICIKALKKIIDIYPKYYQSSRDFISQQMNIRVQYITTAIKKGRGNLYDDIISLEKMTDVLKERYK